jgi:hypothetical protein
MGLSARDTVGSLLIPVQETQLLASTRSTPWSGGMGYVTSVDCYLDREEGNLC